MTVDEALAELRSLGTAQNRKVYARHGAREPMFGVSFANLGMLRRRIKVDHRLATELWHSGNHDARVLATMIADTDSVKSVNLDRWVRDLDSHVVTDAFATMVSGMPVATRKAAMWTTRRDEFVGRAGWAIVARIAIRADAPDDEWFEARIAEIEAGIHAAANRKRESMNSALVAIGTRNRRLQKSAVAAAKRIGRIEVDHGETGCKTADAREYIARTWKHRASKKK